MKGKKKILIGIFIGALLGWALGYLRIPFGDRNISLLVGFILCLAIVSFTIVLLFAWNKHSLLIKLIGKNSMAEDSKQASSTYTIIWILVSVFIVLGGLLSSFLIFKQNELFTTHTQEQNRRIEHQSAMIESIRKSNLVFLMGNILDKVDNELKNNPQRRLSDETIEIIASLSYSFEPYKYLEGDSLSEDKFSLERGQLLLGLSKMNIDSSSFDKIKIKTPFSKADLRGADLRGADLKGINLKEADLRNADLRKADLRGADLKQANLWGAKLRKANLRKTDLKMADLRWADLNGADLKMAELNGADLTSAKLKEVDFSGADLRWVVFNEAFLNKAILTAVRLSGAKLIRANLSGADLSGADSRGVDLSEAILSEANLTRTKLDRAAIENKNWLEKLDKWQVIGAQEIQKRYQIADDSNHQSNFMLKEIID